MEINEISLAMDRCMLILGIDTRGLLFIILRKEQHLQLTGSRVLLLAIKIIGQNWIRNFTNVNYQTCIV